MWYKGRMTIIWILLTLLICCAVTLMLEAFLLALRSAYDELIHRYHMWRQARQA